MATATSNGPPIARKLTWDADTVKEAVLRDLVRIATSWGVRFNGKLNARGFHECHAIERGREDATASAGIHGETGAYKVFGSGPGSDKALSLFDLAIELGHYPDFPSAVNGLGEQLRVPPKAGPYSVVRHEPTLHESRPKPEGTKAAPKKIGPGHKTYPEAFQSYMEWDANHKKPQLDGYELVSEYRYVNAAGAWVATIVRLEKFDEDGTRVAKSFRPFHRGDDDRWRSGKPAKYPLYGLRDLPPGGLVVFTEGEKCRDLAASIGLAAVACAHGAQSPGMTDHSPLAGRDVAILRDADEAGEAFGEKLSKILVGLEPPAEVRVVTLPDLAKGEDIEQFIGKHPGRAEALDAVKLAIDSTPCGNPGQQVDAEQIGRLPVEISTRRFQVVEDSLKALADDPNLFRRGDMLVTVLKEDASEIRLTTLTAMDRVEGSPKICKIADQVIGERLSRYGDLYQWKVDRNGTESAVPAHPPEWLIKNLATRGSWPGIRLLVSVAECPYPRPDGTLVETPGYDPGTAILYQPSMDFPPIPKAPGREEAQGCWARIRGHFQHYPFASEDDEVIILAGMLNVIARHGIIGPTPGIAINGNKAGIGKGFLVDAMVIPGTGRIAPISKYPHDPLEAGKVKTSIVRSGKTVVSFDNLSEGTRYGGEDVDSLITARLTDDRVLGVSEQTGNLIVRLSCFVNGNNIEPVKDAYRRWLVCNLVTEHEHPERRDIRNVDGTRAKTPDVVVLENRGQVVRDCLTILRAHANAGWPTYGWAPLGSFDHWDKVVRGAVWYATGRDCTKTQETAAEESEDSRLKVALLEGFRELPGAKFGQRGVTCQDACQAITDFPDRYPTLRSAMIQRGQKGSPCDPRVLGNIFRGLMNSPNGGYRLLKHPTLKHKVVAWVVDCVENIEGGSGGTGGSLSTPGVRDFDSSADVMVYAEDAQPY